MGIREGCVRMGEVYAAYACILRWMLEVFVMLAHRGQSGSGTGMHSWHEASSDPRRRHVQRSTEGVPPRDITFMSTDCTTLQMGHWGS